VFILVTTKYSTVCNGRECYDGRILGQGRWREEIKVFLLKTNDEKM